LRFSLFKSMLYRKYVFRRSQYFCSGLLAILSLAILFLAVYAYPPFSSPKLFYISRMLELLWSEWLFKIGWLWVMKSYVKLSITRPSSFGEKLLLTFSMHDSSITELVVCCCNFGDDRLFLSVLLNIWVFSISSIIIPSLYVLSSILANLLVYVSKFLLW
jgi:hypothetical protein